MKALELAQKQEEAAKAKPGHTEGRLLTKSPSSTIKPPDPDGFSYATDIDFITIFPMSGKIGNQIGIIQRCGDILYIEGVTP